MAGGVISFECVENAQIDATGNGRYTQSLLSSTVADSYYAIDFAAHSTYITSTTWNGNTFNVDRNINAFYLNRYE